MSANGIAEAPAFGLRSAVPLGGLGTGSFELRADGTFADWTIENQGTALAADATRNSKLPIKSEAFLGVWARAEGGDAWAAALRVQPPAASPAIPRVGELEYSGAFPFSRLGFTDAAFPLGGGGGMSPAVFAYAPFRAGSSSASAIPAVAFSLVLSNPLAVAANISFLLSLPLGASLDTDRPLGAGPAGFGDPDPRGQVLAVLNETNLTACQAACAASPNCTWYRHSGAGVPPVPPSTAPNFDCEFLRWGNDDTG